jgi:phosphohistidine phosphatase
VRLLLLRHGLAEDAGPATGFRDEPRALTPEGARRARLAAAGMARLGLTADVALHSPLRRCRETAAIVAEAIAAPLADEPRLAPGLDLDGLEDALLRRPDAATVLVCAHQPDLSDLVEDLTGGRVAFRPTTLAILDVDEVRRGGGRLRSVHPPSLLGALGEPPA